MSSRAEGRPYGTWTSPVTAESIVGGTISLSQPAVSSGALYWLEGRPQEGGRNVLVRRGPGGEIVDVTPQGFNVRTRVHEYGGGSYVGHGETVYFSNFADQRLYRQDLGTEPRPITPEPAEPAALRFADATVSSDGTLIVTVCERHLPGGNVENVLVAIPSDGSAEPTTIVGGADFYSSPRLSRDGKRLAWLAWDHPNMPWDESELWVADITEGGQMSGARLVAGGKGESIFQPEWGPGDDLYFVSDRTGWWNLYRQRAGAIQALAPMEAEFGQPQWVFGLSRYAFLNDGSIAAIYTMRGEDRLGVISERAEVRELDIPFNTLGSLVSDGERLSLIAAGPNDPPALVSIDPRSGAVEVIRRSSQLEIDPGYVSVAQSIEFPADGGRTAFAFYYPPANRDFMAPVGERPPLIVMSHGGPTSATSPALDPRIQFWTSRGFAVVDVNYRGSSGYGRDYREQLKGTWGIADVADCSNAAHYLVEQGLADAKRLAIRGGSAGGYTTLSALAFTQTFTAGASHYGVSDLEMLARDTHKFESRYLDGLVGPYPAAREVYLERSPIHSASRLSCPVILFQGLDDKVVPPSQAEEMVGALDERRLPHAYVPFEGEGHGFRRGENIQRALEAELHFYGRIWGFEPADEIEPVEIPHIDRLHAG